jgi:dephospho-CoA kinase
MAERPYVIGLTGNIATGKTTVARMLAALGACVIDADLVAHELMRAGTAVHRALVARFGETILGPDGEIDRQRLAAIVFADPAALADLDATVHPAVVRETPRLVAECAAPVAVVEAIKLLEAGMDRQCDAVWVVTLSRERQVDRLVRRSGLSREQAEQRVDAQPPQADKMARANVVIDNGGTLAETRAQVQAAWAQLPVQGPGKECGTPCAPV